MGSRGAKETEFLEDPSWLTFLRDESPLQRDLHRQERWANITSVEFNKSKWQILHLGQCNAGHEHKLGDEWPSSSPGKGNLGYWWKNRSSMSQQWALSRGQTMSCAARRTVWKLICSNNDLTETECKQRKSIFRHRQTFQYTSDRNLYLYNPC